MKIIKRGEEKEIEPQKITCSKCHSDLEYVKSDLKVGFVPMGLFFPVIYPTASITCPVCQKIIDVDPFVFVR